MFKKIKNAGNLAVWTYCTVISVKGLYELGSDLLENYKDKKDSKTN